MFVTLLILIAAAWLIRDHWFRLHMETPGQQQYFWRWLALGFAVPCVVWGISNLGLSERSPPLAPQIATAQTSNHPWTGLWVAAMVLGAAAIFLNWAAFTYIWMMWRIAHKTDAPAEVNVTVIITTVVTLAGGMWFCWRSGWGALAPALLLVFGPMVMMTLPYAERPRPIPHYSRAVAKIKFGKYVDAEWEVINQLEKKEDDFDGWMMLAELYATQHKRLDEAAKVIVDLCNDPGIQPVQVSLACNRLADWHLELGFNPAGARAALDLLIQRLPGTHFALMAELRLRQIPRTREEFLEEKNPRPLRLPTLREHFEGDAAPALSKKEALQEVDKLVQRLTDDPNHIGNREKLAFVLAENLRKVDTAAEQLRLLIQMEETTREQRAKWLAQIAAWERRLNQDEKRFCLLLEEILREYPNTTHALAARRQLDLIEIERLQQAAPPQAPASRPIIRLVPPEA